MTRWLGVVIAWLLVGGVSVSGQPAAPSLPLVQASHLRYLGQFMVPSGANGCLTYGGAALTRSPRGLFIGGHLPSSQLAEIGIPAIGGTAQLLTPCTTVPNLDQLTREWRQLGGAMLWGAEVVVSAYEFYDGDHSTTKSHMAYNLHTGAASPFVQVGAGGGRTGGYMAPVPVEWVGALGCAAVTGQGALSIISRTNAGYGLSCFDPSQVSSGQDVPGVELLAFPDTTTRTADTWSGQSLIYNSSTRMGGMIFPNGTGSVLFFARQGTTVPCYGTRTTGGPNGSGCANTGGSDQQTYHAAPYLANVVAYAAADLVQVRAGALAPWAPRPYARWELPQLQSVAGVAYDATSQRIYITEHYGERPAVHVYALEVGPTPQPTPTPAPETFTVRVTAPVGAQQITVSVPASIGPTMLSVPLTIDVPVGSTVVDVTCTRPAGGTWRCEVP